MSHQPVHAGSMMSAMEGAPTAIDLSVTNTENQCMNVIDIAFRIHGGTIPVDHGYLVYSALSRILPQLHAPGSESGSASGRLAIHPINGRLAGSRQLKLIPESRLTFRASADSVGALLSLVGKSLDIGGSNLDVHTPELIPLRPAARLYSRLVVIKGYLEPEPFLAAVSKQMELAAIAAEAGLPLRHRTLSREGRIQRQQPTPLRRTIQIRDKQVVGYAVAVSGLSADSSLLLQEVGLGGRRHFGCGVFVPAQ